MAEKIKITKPNEFYSMLQEAGEINTGISAQTKVLKEQKNSLKDYMIENDIEKAEAGAYSLTAFETTRRSMNETKLMELIKEKSESTDDEEEAELLASCIKYVPQVDEELVEKLVYEGVIPESFLADALTETTSVGLRFGKVKKGE